MKKLKVKIVGCGGIGLCLINVLPRYLSYLKDVQTEMSFINGDVYEESNRPRQSFRRYGNKAEVTAETIREEFPNIVCWTTTDYLTPDNVRFVIREGNIIFSCVDNHTTRKLLSDRCAQLKDAVLISGGNEYTDGNIQVYVKQDGHEYTLPIANQFHPEILSPVDQNPGQRNGGCGAVAQSQPQLLIANNMVAAMMLNAFYGYMEGIFGNKDNRYDEVYMDVKLNKARPVNRS